MLETERLHMKDNRAILYSTGIVQYRSLGFALSSIEECTEEGDGGDWSGAVVSNRSQARTYGMSGNVSLELSFGAVSLRPSYKKDE